MIEFDKAFKALTGNPPFPWQQALYDEWFSKGKIPPSCNLPTGLGKTSVIAVWLIALANHPDKMPRRLVYVVNRRTVVDQTTDEVEKYRFPLAHRRAPVHPVLLDLADALARLSSDPSTTPLAVSTLRGQFADNREWSADPSRTAVICGTVDMIGSRLVFSGYGVGMKGKPLHAGFLGQDALLVHDEAHLEPAFQDLLLAIEKEQKREREGKPDLPWPPLRVMELTATPRSGGKVFELTDREKKPEENWHSKQHEPIHEVWRRTHSKKLLALHEIGDEKKELVANVVQLALRYTDDAATPAVLVFVRTVEAVNEVVKGLKGGKVGDANVLTLTGTMRGFERDQMATGNGVFARFRKQSPASPQPGTVYLVCTSAGEVGVDISADHIVCDLSTFDSMAQRFGRVNRYGTGAATIDVVYPAKFETKEKPFEAAREKTLGLLKRLRVLGEMLIDASPAALGELIERAIRESGIPDRTQALREYVLSAFAPPPVVLPATEILFDAWALTTIRDKLPGRPEVEPYLHGFTDDTFDTEFAWREEVALLTDKVPDADIAELMDEFPLKPHETMRIPTYGRLNPYSHLEAIRERDAKIPAWVIEPNGTLTTYSTLDELLKKQGKDYAVRLAERVVVLPPKAGGLTANGTLDGTQEYDKDRQYDVAGTPPEKVTPLLRLLVTPTDDGEKIEPVGRVRDWPLEVEIRWKGRTFRITGQPPLRVSFTLDIPDRNDEEAPAKQYVVVKPIQTRTGDTPAAEWPGLDKHLEGVAKFAAEITTRLKLDRNLADAVIHAAKWHDHGKARPVWQRGAGNKPAHGPVAKTLHGRAPENLNHYRHELGSMVDVSAREDLAKQFDDLDDDHKDVVLHLIATHHGRGRPHFPAGESHDIDRPTDVVSGVVTETPGRFARLQRQYGRWGLAYLESLLRAADILESQRIEASPIPDVWPKADTTTPPKLRLLPPKALPNPSITVAVDPINPGQFFACCGLLELADRLWPGAEGWFGEGGRVFNIDRGTLREVLDAVANCHLTNTMTETQHTRFKEITAMKVAERKSTPGVEAEEKLLGALLREAPIVLSGPFAITLDWFADGHAGGSRFKTWAGRQSVLDISTAMKEALASDAWRHERCLSFSVTKCGLPFNFDSNLGGQGGAIDIGFSFDPLAGSALTRIEPSARPALELFAFVGLQRFRPEEIKGENRFVYTAWDRPLPIGVAAPAACGALPTGGDRFEFRLLYRTKYLKSFLPAIPFTGGSDE